MVVLCTNLAYKQDVLLEKGKQSPVTCVSSDYVAVFIITCYQKHKCGS